MVKQKSVAKNYFKTREYQIPYYPAEQCMALQQHEDEHKPVV